MDIPKDAIRLNPDGSRPKVKTRRIKGLSGLGKGVVAGAGLAPFAVMAYKARKSKGEGNAKFKKHIDEAKKAADGTYAGVGAGVGALGGTAVGGAVGGLTGASYGYGAGALAGSALGRRIDRKPKGKLEKRLSAILDEVIDFEKLDLGYTDKDLYGNGSLAAYDPKKEANKKRYPNLHISRYSGDPFKFPDTGEAKIKFKVVSRETNKRDDKERNSLTLEIQNIDTGSKGKELSALRAGVIDFGSMSTKRIDRVLRSRLKKLGAGPEHFDKEDWYYRISDARRDPAVKKATIKWESKGKSSSKRHIDRLSNLSAILDTVDFTDPRPRNQQGMFADVSEAGANPDTMRKAYGSKSGINPDVLKKLRRRLPRFAIEGM